MLELAALTLREIRLPLKEPFVTSSGMQHARRILLLEVCSRDGYTAWSECVAQETPSYSPETVETAWLAIREWLVPILKGQETLGPIDLLLKFDASVRGHPMAKAAVEMACWNLHAQRQGVALAGLLGGAQARVPVGVAMGIQKDPAELAHLARRRVDEGYRKLKLKIKPGADHEYVEAVRHAVGNDVALAVDANGAYSLEDTDLLKSLDAFQLTMLEQPFHRDDLISHARLQKHIDTPICLDESITNSYRVKEMIRLDSGRIVNVKPGRVGGFGPAMGIHDLCRANGLGAWVGGMLESGIGRAYNVALASLPNFTLPADISPSSRYWDQDIVQPEWTMSTDGYVDVPLDRPGLGVDVDQDRIDDLTTRSERITL